MTEEENRDEELDDILSPLGSLEIRGDKLYFNGKPVNTGIRLEGWSLGAAWFAAFWTAITAVLTFLAYKEPIFVSLGLTSKTDSNYYFVTDKCDSNEGIQQGEKRTSSVAVKPNCISQKANPLTR